MKFNISAFTHPGTKRLINEDNILVNGVYLNEGEIHITEKTNCVCFVADGVGGNLGGKFASQFVLEKIKLIDEISNTDKNSVLQNINSELLSTTTNQETLQGAATTLSGLILKNNNLEFFHAGDSQIWLLRNNIFFQITTDHVLDDLINNSPITSYFGGFTNNLKLENNTIIQEHLKGDYFMICSDGLFKSLNQKTVKSIISSDIGNDIKVKSILKKALENGANDNISVILIQIIE
jgi:serine/threonine protein phosphatase PrpC